MYGVSEKRALLAAVALALAFFAQAFLASRVQSLTWDETSYISAGYVYLTHGDFRLNPSHPPLSQELAALPTLLLDLHAPPYPDHWLEHRNAVLHYGVKLMFGSGNDPRRVAAWARLPILLLGTLLIFGIFLWGRALFGSRPALVATAAAAFCPNLLAHAQLATEDLSCTTLVFAAVAMFWQALQSRRPWVLGACGVVTGLALLSKYTALLVVPIDLALALWLVLRRSHGVTPVRALQGCVLVAGVAFLVVGAGYNFTFSWRTYAAGISAIYGDLSPNISTYKFYLLGRISDTPYWYYNLIGLLTKVPLPTVGLFVFAALACVRSRKNLDRVVVLLVPAVALVAVSFFDRMNFGLRRILPAFPFLLLFTAHALTDEGHRAQAWLVALLLALTTVETLRVYPHHLSYLNTLAGGPENGPYVFDDSNIDWGQDLPALADWQRQYGGATPLRFWYFGTASPAAYGVTASTPDRDEELRPRRGVYAVSAHTLVSFRKRALHTGADVDWLTKYRPIARAGYSIYLYRFE